MKSSAPIGIFDSGVGGLSILRAIRTTLPHEDLFYVADSGHVPYGTKSPEYLQQRAITITRFLLSQQVKAVVIACNTATVAAVRELRRLFPVPIVAVEPAVKPAVAVTQTGTIGVIATAATLASAQFLSLLERFGTSATILTQACPHLVHQVEAGDLTSSITYDLVRHYTLPLLNAGADTLVLGCTHYPFLRPMFVDVAGPDVNIIDTGDAVTRQLARVLSSRHLLNAEPISGKEVFWTSGDVQSIEPVISVLWGQPVIVQRLPQDVAGSSNY